VLNLLIVVAGLFLILLALVGLSFFISCIRERERRATNFAAVQLAALLTPVLVFFLLLRAGFFEGGVGAAVLTCGIAAAGAGCFLLLRRSGGNPRALEGTRGRILGEVEKWDERAIVFARNEYLQPGSKEYEEFYEKHPEWEEADAKRRKVGGLFGATGKLDEPQEAPNRAAWNASLMLAFQLGTPDKVELEPQAPSTDLTPEDATQRVKGYAKSVGADLVGVAELDPRWVYSHRGMVEPLSGETWGQPIEVGHRYAIVFAQEMARDMIDSAPHVSSCVESMNQYARGATTAYQVASYVANLGYSATANHVSHYDCLMVPLAVDAGLGEMGRLGYLMTTEFGPRQRLSAVTTDLPLVPDEPVDIGVEDFCSICLKCADRCPSQSIPHGEQAEANGSLRWKLDEITCFDYWGKVGTDCNVCMRVCPWSHARTLPHRLIVWMVSRNSMARRLFFWMDDLFYGKRPRRKAPPAWVGPVS
jgi:reductive dehalogenase